MAATWINVQIGRSIGPAVCNVPSADTLDATSAPAAA